ncbi:hypothetical protein GF322_05400 [Candidatus Dependentiae bacterium]|nr:hypothetical protein [Candidatus Dependentiae bacterium]
MIKIRFLTILFTLNIVFIFIKIYQHNLLIRLTYEKQRIEKHKNDLKKQKNDLRIKYLTIIDQEKIYNLAKDKLGMQSLKLSQITTCTNQTKP